MIWTDPDLVCTLKIARCSGSQKAHFAEVEIIIHGSKYEAVGIKLLPRATGGSRALKRARQRERRKLGKAGAESQVEVVGHPIFKASILYYFIS